MGLRGSLKNQDGEAFASPSTSKTEMLIQPQANYQKKGNIMSKIEERKSAAAQLVELYKGLIAALPEDTEWGIEAKDVIRISADVMNSANRKLFPNEESLGAAIAGTIMQEYNLRSEIGFEACKAFGMYFATIYDAEPDAFSPQSRRLELLKSAFFIVLADALVTVSDLAKKLEGEIATNRALVKNDIAAGRLKAKKMGKQYFIEPQDAAEWLSNPARGSRRKAE